MAVRVRAGGEEGGSGDQLNNHIGSYIRADNLHIQR